MNELSLIVEETVGMLTYPSHSSLRCAQRTLGRLEEIVESSLTCVDVQAVQRSQAVLEGLLSRTQRNLKLLCFDPSQSEGRQDS